MEPSGSTPPMSSSGAEWRMPVLFIAGLVVGGALTFFLLPYLLNSAVGQAVFPQYHLVMLPQAVENSHAAGELEPTALKSPTEQGISAKAAGVNAAYAAAACASLDAFNELNNFNAERLSPALKSLNTKLLAGDYSGILDQVTETKQAITAAAQLNRQFEVSLQALAKANTEANAEVKTATEKMEATGLAVNAAFGAYLNAVSGMLSGVPTQQQINDFAVKAQAYTTATVSFQTSVAALNAVLDGKTSAPAQ